MLIKPKTQKETSSLMYSLLKLLKRAILVEARKRQFNRKLSKKFVRKPHKRGKKRSI